MYNVYLCLSVKSNLFNGIKNYALNEICSTVVCALHTNMYMMAGRLQEHISREGVMLLRKIKKPERRTKPEICID